MYVKQVTYWRPTKWSYIPDFKELQKRRFFFKVFKVYPIWIYVKQVSPWVEPFKSLRLLPWTISYEVHKIKIYTKYQRPWLPKVLNKKIPPIYVFVKQVSSGAGLFYFSLRAIIWTILVEALKMKLHTNYKRPRPSSFREDFLNCFFHICVYVKPVTPGSEPFLTLSLSYE